jgi:hypothetical protein
MNYCSVYAYYCGVIPETVSIPPAAAITVAAITIAIINAAIKAYMRPPIARMEPVNTTIITPVRRRPVNSRIWRGHPNAGYPVIAALVTIISPITGLPYITVNRAFGLFINP